jgi:hypothetical protein
MQDRHREPLRALAATAAILAVTLALALSAGLAYAAEDEEEDVPLDTKLFRQFMKDIGAQRDGPPIEYRERAPLVVPPSRNLPPPQEITGSVTANPAWPKDPDAYSRRKQTAAAAAAERARLKGSVDRATDDARPLSPAELDRGRVATSNSGPVSPEADDAQRPMRPDQLGNKRTIFDNVFNMFTRGKPETAPFTSEPPRTSMTAPPPGYQTPSPDQPYGVGAKDNRKASTVVDRAEVAR